ncbi:hypothetical protein RI543_002633 [Arxiozyma heterogenica]|uniref:Uncharacterized protein n=1 Tax=Arxiozyma heterogenica TaxID=278026 RepID=A0AAN7ZXX6_9SACH|nr:hypothetical protein RI543_002633 [Kazachstania heterogenica]
MIPDANKNINHYYKIDLDQTKRPSENLYHLLHKDSVSNSNWNLKNKPSFCSFVSSVPSLNSIEGNQSILSKESIISNSTTTSPNLSTANTDTTTTNIIPPDQCCNHHYLTPSQRYRLRKNQNQKQLRNYIYNKDLYSYENKHQNQKELEDRSEVAHSYACNIDNDIDDSILWNIPKTHYPYFNPLNSKNVLATVTTIPGINNGNEYPCKDENKQKINPSFNESKIISDMVSTLSNQYIIEVSKKTHDRVKDRYQNIKNLPIEIKELNSMGLEDMKCVSSNKLKYLNQGRPIWLPPKTTHEIEKYKTEMKNCMDTIYKEEMVRHKWLNDYKLFIEKSYGRLFSYNNSSSHSKVGRTNWIQNIKFLKQIIKKIPLPYELRYDIYMNLLDKPEHFEDFDKIYNKYERIIQNDSYPYDKLLEIKVLIQDKIENKKILTIDDQKILSTIFFLLKLKSISNQGLIKGDEIIIHHLIKMNKLSIEQIWNLLQIIQYNINNNNNNSNNNSNNNNLYENDYEWYCLETPRIMKLWDTRNDYKYTYWWDIMERIDNIDLFFWILDTIVVITKDFTNKTRLAPTQSLKFMISLPLLITRDYHYGWDSLSLIHDTSKYRLLFPGDDSTDLLYKNYRFMCKLWGLANTL